MIKISVNNISSSIEDQITLGIFLKNRGTNTDYAVALNGEFIPRSQYNATVLKADDELDIVSPVGGG